MRKRVISILTLIVVLLNTILVSIPSADVSNEVYNSYISQSIEDGIEDVEIYEDRIAVITKKGQAIFIKNGEKVVLEGNNYSVLSKNLLINEDGLIFNLSTEEYEAQEESDKYNKLYSKLKENYVFENMYILNDEIALINKSDELYEIKYYVEEEGQFIETKKVETLNTNSITFDVNGTLYIDGKGDFSKCVDGEFISVSEIPGEYNVRVFDEDRMVLFNETEYILVNNYVEKEEDTEVDNVIDTDNNIIVDEEENSTTNEDVELFSNGEVGVAYQTHVQNEGWQEWKSNGQMSGTSGKSYRLEGIRIKVENLPEGAKISYRTHIEDLGWQEWKSDGEMSGTEKQSKRLEGIEIKLENAPGYSVEYRVHVQDIGWQAWRKNGAMAGTSGQSKRLEGIEIKIVKDVAIANLSYTTHVRNEGWKNEVSANEISGSSSNNILEGIKLNYNDPENNIAIQYRGHVQGTGWQDWRASGELAGTEGESKALEAVEIKLVNAPSDYHVKYRVKTKDYGWQGWKQDGDMAGTTGLSGEIIAIQVKVEKDVVQPTITYQTHVQNEGWQSWKSDGALSGTEGKSLRLEAIKINLENLEESNEVMYRTHVQNEGWQNWVSNGSLSGTSGKGYRLEAIQIKLKNEIPGYQLYYRVHVQDYGWQEWKQNGEVSGTVGSSKRLEAIEIKLVKDRNQLIVIDPGHNFGGDDGAYATHSGVRYIERDLNMQVASKLKKELEARGFEVAMTRNPEDRETLAMRESLQKRVKFANNLNADFFISVHQNAATASSAAGVEAYYSSATPLSGGVLNSRGIEYNAEDRRMSTFASNSKVTKSKEIATEMVNNIASSMSRNNRKVWDDDFYVVKNTYMPSVLIECGFITNANEARNLASDKLQQQMAEIIANSISKNL